MADYYVDPINGCDFTGDGAELTPFRSFFRPLLDSTAGRILVKAGSTIQLEHIGASAVVDAACAHSIGVYGGTGYVTFEDQCVITGTNKTPLLKHSIGNLNSFRTVNVNGNYLPHGWVDGWQYPTGDNPAGGYVTAWDDDEDGQYDCCAIGSDGAAARGAINLVRTFVVATGQSFSVSVDLKSDGNANGQVCGLFVSLKLGATTRYWEGGTTWGTTAPGVGAAGNQVKHVVDDAAQTFSTAETTWKTYTFTFVVPDGEWGTGGTFSLFDLSFGFCTRETTEGKTLLRNVRLPQTQWVNEPATNFWYLPTKSVTITNARMRIKENGYVKIGYNTRAECDTADKLSCQSGILAVYRTASPDLSGETWQLYRREVGFTLSGAVTTIDHCKFLGVHKMLTDGGALTSLDITDSWFEDLSGWGYYIASGTTPITVTDCYFKEIGDYKAWDQWGDYTPGGGYGIYTVAPFTIDGCFFEQCYADIFLTGAASTGTIQRCVMWETEVNSIWVQSTGGAVGVLNNTLYNFGAHGIVFRNQGTSGNTMTLRNNVLYSNKNYASGDYPVYLQQDIDGALVDSDYNLFYRAVGGAGQIFVMSRAPSYGGDDVAACYTATEDEQHSLVANPAFINAAGRFLRVQSTSPAIDAGVDVSLTTDYAGVAIPQGVAPDIGAYEGSDGSGGNYAGGRGGGLMNMVVLQIP